MKSCSGSPLYIVLPELHAERYAPVQDKEEVLRPAICEARRRRTRPQQRARSRGLLCGHDIGKILFKGEIVIR